MLTTVLVAFCSYVKQHDRKQREKGRFDSTAQIRVHHGGNTRQELTQMPWRNAKYCLALQGLPSLLSSTPQDLPEMALPTVAGTFHINN